MKVTARENKIATRFSRRLKDQRAIRYWQAEKAREKRNMPTEEKLQSNSSVNSASSSNANNNNDLAVVLQNLILKSESSISSASFENIIPDFDGEEIQVEKWFQNFESNADAYGLTEKQKYIHARNKIKGTAKLFLDAVTVSEYNTLKNILQEEFHKDLDSAEIHTMLSNRKRKYDETFHEYVLQMNKIAVWGKIEEKAIIKYIVNGLAVTPEAKYLLYSSKSIKELRENFDIVEKVMVNKTDDNKKYDTSKKTSNNGGAKKIHCFNCGSTSHKRSDCKENTKCFKCNEKGHIAKNCPQLTKTVNLVIKPKRFKTVALNGVEIECLVDTGSDVTVVKKSVFNTVSDSTLENSQSSLRGLGNKKTVPVGEFLGEITVDGITVTQKFVVVPDSAMENNVLLGFDFTSKFRFEWDESGFLFTKLAAVEDNSESKEMSIYNITETKTNIVVPPQYTDRVMSLIDNYKPKPQNQCPIEMTIIPDSGMKTFRQAPSRLPPEEAIVVREQVEEWLQKGVVRKSFSPFASRIVPVKKKDGTLRVCVDFRKLNSMVLKDGFPVPVMEDIYVKLQSSKYFTSLDLENGFFHVPVNEQSKKYTAFATKEGLFEFNVAPFGFCNSPAAFIRYLSSIFQDLINENILELYMDDIIVFAKSAEECLEKVAMVLALAEKHNLKIKWRKCKFLQTKISFLGHEVEDGNIKPGEEKVEAVKKFNLPTNIKGIQSFLGLTGFFRKFIEGYAKIARPLTNLLKKDVAFEIGTAEREAIDQLKTCLTSQPVLKIYSRGAHTEVHTDASKDGFGAVLFQEFEGKLHPVFFWSKKTSRQDEKRHSYVLEVKAAFLAVNKFRNYLLGIRFKLVTDCAAFRDTTNKKDVPKEVVRWIIYLQDFNYTVEHRPGERMKHVDFLSRYPHNVLTVTTEISARILNAQKKDEYIKTVAEILKTSRYQDYKMKGGLVYKSEGGNDLLVVPKLMEAEIIREAHNEGHFGVQKSMHTVQQKYYIPHLEKKVKQMLANCIHCIIHNKKLGKREGYLNCIDKGDTPLHTLHMDHLGPMDSTGKQYKYIFAIIDGFTKFVWLYPTKSTSAEEVLKKLESWSDVFGNPTRIVSDRGGAFISNVFKEYVTSNNIEHIVTTAGVARGNGQVERLNRSILSIIAKMSTEDTSKWYKFVSRVQVTINSHVQSSTKVSPFELLFGIKMNHKKNDVLIELLEQEMVTQFDEERRKLRENAKHQILQAQSTYKKNYDRSSKPQHDYKSGDLVAIKRTQFVAGKKLASEYLGPYEIIKIKPNGRYDVKKAAVCEGPNSTSTSCDNMKLWKYVVENEDLLSSGSDDDDQDGRM